MLLEHLKSQLRDHIRILDETINESSATIIELVEVISHSFQNGNKLLLCGNGGSAADAQHIAAEMINRFSYDRHPLPAIALTTDTSVLTSISNDYGFEQVFSRQVQGLGVAGDILIGISTSGASSNVLKALSIAKQKKIITIGFTGEKGKQIMSPLCDYCLVASSTNTARIQECHEFILHLICGMVEEKIYPSGNNYIYDYAN